MEELLDEPGNVPARGFVKFKTFPDLFEVQILRARLEAEDISCFIPNEHTLTVNPLYINALGGAQLWIYSDDLSRAGQILGEIESAPYTDDADNVIECPRCGSTHLESGHKSIHSPGSFVSWLFALLTATYPIYSKRMYRCHDCRIEFKPEK